MRKVLASLVSFLKFALICWTPGVLILLICYFVPSVEVHWLLLAVVCVLSVVISRELQELRTQVKTRGLGARVVHHLSGIWMLLMAIRACYAGLFVVCVLLRYTTLLTFCSVRGS